MTRASPAALLQLPVVLIFSPHLARRLRVLFLSHPSAREKKVPRLLKKVVYLHEVPLYKQPDATLRRPHALLPLCKPVITFDVNDPNAITYGVAVKAIFKFEGMDVKRLGQLWGDMAPGSMIFLTIQVTRKK
ncbi:hypothetical protein H0H87_009880 [Tephrocybe sp. NHM501043]|nr:hypothetical protein H0H87_009880 [Tephrocybe sp. NHM501043]